MRATFLANKKRLSFIIFMALLLTAVGICILYSAEHVQGNFWVIASFVLNTTLFTVQLLWAIWKHPFSFDMMFWLFSLFFFGYAPWLQYLSNVYAWSVQPTHAQVLTTNLLVLLWSVCYLVGRSTLAGTKLQGVLLKAARCVWRLLKRAYFGLLSSRIVSALRKAGNLFSTAAKKLCSLAVRCCKTVILWLDRHTPLKMEAPAQKTLSAMRQWWTQKQARSPAEKALDVLLLLSICVVIYYLIFVGFTNLFARSSAEIPADSTTVYLLLTHGFKNTVLFTAVLFILRLKKIKKLDLRAVIAAACLLLACFPTAMSRNMLASFYAGLLIIMIDKSRKGRWFSLIILGGLVLVFPAVEAFRLITNLQNHSVFDLILSSFQTTYLAGHYDAHQMFISIQDYVSNYGLTWGRQLLGALLFFIPRSIWPGKPTGTGHTVFTALQHSFTNVSAPLVAESYVNFGVAGIILFAFVLGALLRILDSRYWKNSNPYSLIRFLYPFSMFQFFFLLRGDMISGFSYLTAQAVVGSVIYFFAVYRSRINKEL